MCLPSGTQIHYSQYLVHRDPEIWPEPEVLNPERWSEERKVLQPYTYLPFLHGPRSCPAKHFSVMAIKLVLVSLLQNFELYPRLDREKMPVVDQGMATMRIRNKIEYQFVPLLH